MKTDASTTLYCIFGNPVKHSLSPVIHNTAFRELDLNSVYLAFSPASARDAVFAMRALSIQGASVTIPFKTEIIKYIDDIDQTAKMIGAVNTLKNINGKICGYNTDGLGALQALTDRNLEIRNSRVLILGNGGSARAIAYTFAERGAEVIIAGRNEKKIKALSGDIASHSMKTGSILISNLNPEFMKDIDIIVNTTPVGMEPDTGESPLHENNIMKHHTVFDIVYAPEKTQLLRIAEDKNALPIGGISMLINQGLHQFRIWTGLEPPAKKINEVIHSHLYKNRI